MLKAKKYVGVVVAVLILLAPLFFNNSAREEVDVFLGGERLVVWIARSPKEITAGLSGVKELGVVDGMLFVLPEEKIPSFWMKDMHFPIDIIWINNRKEVVEVHSEVQPESYPELFSPKEEVKYVLETVAGWAEEKEVVPGKKLILSID